MPDPQTTHRPVGPTDLDRIVALDRATGGTSRRGFFAKRFAAMARTPDAFLSVGAWDGDALVGFVLCHVLDGEFGGTDKSAVLDAIAVDPAHQGHGTGHALMDELCHQARACGAADIRSQAGWEQREVLDFFAGTGFSLAPRLVLERPAETVSF